MANMVKVEAFVSEIKQGSNTAIQPADLYAVEIDPDQVKDISTALYGRRGCVVRLRCGLEHLLPCTTAEAREALGLDGE